MAKTRIVIADADVNYIVPLQKKLAEEYFEKVDLEIITDKDYFNEMFSVPQKIDILIISEELYNQGLHRHNISNIFLMTEQYEEEQTVSLNVNRIYKYTSIKEIFNEIEAKSSGVLGKEELEKKETQVVVVYSISGGAGKTTVAMGVSKALSKYYKKVLYINAERLQTFHNLMENATPITTQGIYSKLLVGTTNIYEEIKRVINKEEFAYMPPFKASLMSLGLKYEVYRKIILSAKKSKEYDYIVVDTDVCFDEEKAELLDMADKVIVVTGQTMPSVMATNVLVSNVNGVNNDKYIFVCNNFDRTENNALISPNVTLKYKVNEYIEHFDDYERMCVNYFEEAEGIQRTALLII